MITATREERTGRSLMEPADFRDTVAKIRAVHHVAKYDAETALDQAIALVMTVAVVSETERRNLWLSDPVDQAWQVWMAEPMSYGHVAATAGAYVERIPMVDPADPEQLIRTAEAIEDQGFVLHRELWRGQRGAPAIALVKSRLLTPATCRNL